MVVVVWWVRGGEVYSRPPQIEFVHGNSDLAAKYAWQERNSLKTAFLLALVCLGDGIFRTYWFSVPRFVDVWYTGTHDNASSWPNLTCNIQVKLKFKWNWITSCARVWEKWRTEVGKMGSHSRMGRGQAAWDSLVSLQYWSPWSVLQCLRWPYPAGNNFVLHCSYIL